MSEIPANPTRTPIPDPTNLTTEQLHREINALQNLMEVRFEALSDASDVFYEGYNRRPTEAHIETEALKREIVARLDAMDKATLVITESVEHSPTLLDREISKITALFSERFNGISTQFRERDIRTDNDKIAAGTAVSAAFQAQALSASAANNSFSAAINKSELSTAKELDSIKLLINTNRDGFATQLADLVARLNRSEAAALGARSDRDDHRSSTSGTVGLIGGIVGGVSLLLALVMGAINMGHSNAGLPPQPVYMQPPQPPQPQPPYTGPALPLSIPIIPGK